MAPSRPSSSTSLVLSTAKPASQAAFHDWVRAIHYSVFRSAAIPGQLIPVETPVIDGLTTYAAKDRQSGTVFQGAWTELGNFIGWMRTSPHLFGNEPDAVHAIGEVLGMAVFANEPVLGSNHTADRFAEALNRAAGDLRLDG